MLSGPDALPQLLLLQFAKHVTCGLGFRMCECLFVHVLPLQSDADMLRHKLDAQQQQLARLQSLTQRLAGSTPGTAAGAAADGSSSAQLAKTAQAASWEASLASPGAKPQGTEWGQNRSGPGAADSLMSETAPDFSLAGGAEPVGSSLDAEQLLSGLEQLAQAVCLLATGQAAAAAAGGDSFSFKHGVGPSGDKPSDRSTGSAGDAGGRGSGNQAGGFGPQMSRLRRLLQTGQVGRKLDWFDPTLLQKMVSCCCWSYVLAVLMLISAVD